jgi:hypothetical protein
MNQGLRRAAAFAVILEQYSPEAITMLVEETAFT